MVLMRVKEELALAKVETVEELHEEVDVRNAKGGDEGVTTGSVIGDRKCGGPVGSDGFKGTSRHAQERTATGDGMLRIPDESQGQKADPETHASGIPSINIPVAGLVVYAAVVKKDGVVRLRNAKGGFNGE